MQVEYNNKLYDVIIEKKNIKNMYLRVKEDLKIYVSCNKFVSIKQVEKMIKENYKSICKMIDRQEYLSKKNNEFYYLGKKYDIVYLDTNSIIIEDNTIYVKNNKELDKWYQKQIKEIFSNRLEECINKFKMKLPKVNLKIRVMKTRWGVCNRSNNNVTLNSNLIKYDIDVIDYVIFHELSHFIHPNHSKNFWNLVSVYVPNYKQLRNELKK